MERPLSSPRGRFEFDAVSDDGTIVACVSTSGAKTARGKGAAGKFHKLQSDMLFLHLLKKARERIIVLTEHDMFDWCEKQMRLGRTPADVSFRLAALPPGHRRRLEEARHLAVMEVTRRQSKG
jgi:hypothetical protein